MFESLIGKREDKRMQLFFHDNDDVEFIKRPIIGQSVTQFNNQDQPIGSWIDNYQEHYHFDGYKNIPADAVQIANNRYFHWEIHDILPDELRPPEDGLLDSDYLSKIADNRAIEITSKAKPKSVYEKLTTWLGAALIIELIIWGIKYVTG